MTEYTPTRNEMLTALVAYRALPASVDVIELVMALPPGRLPVILQEVKDGLTELERAAAEKAWTEGAHAQWRLGQERLLSAIPSNPYRLADGAQL